MLIDLLISKVRVKVLELFLGNPGEIYHVREIVRRVDEEINAVIRRDFVFFPELLAMINKSTGLGGQILANRAKLGKIKYAILSGSFIRGKPYTQNEVDLFIVGTIILPELGSLVKEEEARRNREINFTPMTEEEFAFRKNRRDPFVMGILSKPRVMLLGDEEEMVKL